MSSPKTLVLITGANQGLGYYAAAQLSLLGTHHVLLGSRTLSKATSAIAAMESDTSISSDVSNISPLEIDLNSDSSISSAARTVASDFGGHLDILMHNAGISRAEGVLSDTEPNPSSNPGPSLREQFRQQYDTNVFGVAVATEAFLPLLRKSTVEGGKRISITGSSTSSLELAGKPGSNGALYRIYRSTKTAVNMLVVSYARELEGEGFVVAAACPGYCATNLNLHKGLKDPREGAKVIVRVALAKGEEVHGRLVDCNGVVPW